MGQSDWLEDKLHQWLVAFEAGQDLPVDALCETDANLDTAWRDQLQHAVSCLRRAERLLECPPVATEPPPTTEGQPPSRIGRYRVDGQLGQGGFGRVYQGYDELLERRVAIKVPHGRHLGDQSMVDGYLAEARTVAGLDHPQIVPVYDIGSTAEYPYYQVSKLIEGSTLARRIAAGRLSFTESAQVVASIAGALHYAHLKGIVHRDVKPGNILIDSEGRPYLTDFGLALRERRVGDSGGYLGTPAYMSPEQARGEGHRVDGRSDIFSLGIVLYELLAGRRPFASDSRAKLFEHIATVEPWPLREIDDAIPRELERICLKALSKRAIERYSTAQDLADELQAWAIGAADGQVAKPPSVNPPAEAATHVPPVRPASAPVATPTPGSERNPVRIVPNGLRSFDAGDSDFFIELLPGPRDRDRLPDSIRLWKFRIEERDPARTFAVGLMYGPSGCGKSSLVKAGLLPRLADHVQTVYLEAVVGGTERRIGRELLRACPDAPADAPLPELFAAIRRGDGQPEGRKVCLIIDQFEQWLHGSRTDGHADQLVQALRQCDGSRLQCLLMVRDDFWMAATRFMQQLEIPLVEGQNCNAVDLFPRRHAIRVLTAFGRAYGELPEPPAPLSGEQQQFIEQAVDALADDDKVICVRLSLFAEMAKSRPWTPASLRQLGGAEGVGVAFLQEKFSSRTAPPHHRYHEKAARAVLAALLPEAGTDIKIARRSYTDLLACTEYARRPESFEELIRLLDTELRLITPADTSESDEEADAGPAREQHYQLTHDYLVPSLRQWLVGRQRETRRGRAQLRLAELTPFWTAKPERRRLPNAFEYLEIMLFTRRRDRSAAEQRMLRAAHRHYLSHLAVAVLLVAAGLVGLRWRSQSSTTALINQLSTANVVTVPAIIAQMQPYREQIRPLLQAQLAEAEANRNVRKQLNFSLALLPDDATQLDWLTVYVLDAPPEDVNAIRHALWFRPERSAIVDVMKRHIEEMKQQSRTERTRWSSSSRLLRAGSLIALYDPASLESPELSDELVSDLLAAVPSERKHWVQLLQTARTSLLPAIERAAADTSRSPQERGLAEELQSSFQEDSPVPDSASQPQGPS